MRSSVLLLLVLALTKPGSALAQGSATASLSASSAQLTAGAELQPRVQAQPFALTAAPEQAALDRLRRRRPQSEVLMIVGVAGLVTGLIIDEPIVAIAGAGVAGFGLYLYLSDR